jgi:flavodoxin
MKSLVVYFSLTGSTEFVAKIVAHQLNADLCEVVDKKHKNGKLIYLKGGAASFREKLTKIEVSKSIDEYDFIVVGSPVWAGKITPAIRTFLSLNDFSQKKGAFFITLGGKKPEKSFENLRKTTGFCSVVKELAVSNTIGDRGELEKMVIDWCDEIKKTLVLLKKNGWCSEG